MARCSMNGKELACPVCGSSKVSYYYGTRCTLVFCQNPKRAKNGWPACETMGKASSVTYHWKDPRFGEWLGMAGWHDLPDVIDLQQLKPMQVQSG